VRVRVLGTRVLGASLLAVLLLLQAVNGRAQVSPPVPPSPVPSVSPRPVTGFVSPYEIVRTVRAAGFDPLSPPLREGTTYVLRATDYRGILMRVVVDARSGAIRDANRIVPGPGSYGGYGTAGMESAPYGGGSPPYYGPPPPHGVPIYDEPDGVPSVTELQPLTRQPAPHPSLHPAITTPPPLPRPRPAEVASRKSVAPSTKSDAVTAGPAGAASGRTPVEAPLND
jgi:hypothetical protein